MAFDPPDGILDIGNATLRVGKLEVAETSGLNQGLQNIVKNDLLVTENTEYTTNHKWGLKLPTTWVAEFEVKGHSGKYIDFNFYNENSASNAQGYNLTFMDTTMTLRYDGGSALGGGAATIPTIVGAYRKVNIFFERGVISVSIDGTRYLYHKESDGFNQGLGVASRVVSATGSAFVNLFIEQNAADSAFKNLRIVNGRFISDKTSNIAFIGGNLGVGVNSPKEALDIRGNMHFNRVSNVSQVSVDSNVVTEYTGPHDRPLRKYPEVALTADAETVSGYKGYKVDRSSHYTSGAFPSWKAFNGIFVSGNQGGTEAWISTQSPTTYESSATGGEFLATSQDTFSGAPSGQRNGSWIKLQLPKKIKLDHVVLKQRTGSGGQEYNKNVVIYGSTNDSTWQSIGSFDASVSETITFHTNTTTYYDYFVLHIRSVNANYTVAAVEELEYYGHEEGSASLDTTLKTVYNVPATTGTQLEVYYDAKDLTTMPSPVLGLGGTTINATVYGNPQVSEGAFVFDGTGDYIKTSALPSTFVDDAQHSFSTWFKLDTTSGSQTLFTIGNADGDNQLPHVVVQDGTLRYDFYNNSRTLLDLSLVPNQWYHLAITFSGGNHNSGTKFYINGMYDANINSGGNSPNATLDIQASSPLTIGGRYNGTQLIAGSIANFRLYSKALNAGQVQELYDYQKDYFLGSKSQVTLYKGHLGVGVTEPSGQLELAGDERIQEYPPGPMGPSTSYETLIPGHGVFCWNTVNYYPGNPNENYNGSGMYAKDGATTGWYGPYNGHGGYTGGNVYAGTDFVATSSSGLGFNDAYGNRYYGAWTTFKLPYKINLKKIHIDQWATSDNVNARCVPEDGVILGSNNGSEWYHVHTFTGLQYGGTAGTSSYSAAGEDVTITCNTDYSQYALVVTRTLHYAFTAMIGELRWFGTPGPTTLDKGSLTLGRSLDVPRVSRYDVDTETPRPEKLVVDFDTTVNESPTDISGKGNHGVFHDSSGAPSYSPADKAFNFSGVNGVIYSGALSPAMTGDRICSMSCWFKPSDAANNNTQTLMWLGAYSGQGFLGLLIQNNQLKLTIGSDRAIETTSSPIQSNQWYHVVAIKSGTGQINSSTANSILQIYINGEKSTDTTFQNQTGTLNITTNYLYLGAGNTTGAEHFSGYISNPKLYNTVLEPSEVKKLYNLGRTGRSMVISDTAVGIGKVPEAQLDVRGNLNVDGVITNQQRPVFYAYYSGTATTTNGYTGMIGFPNTRINVGNCFNTSDYKFYAPITGYYWFEFQLLAREGTGTGHMTTSLFKNGTNVSSRAFAYTMMIGSSDHDNLCFSIPVQMNAGDNIYPGIVACDTTVNAYFGEELAHFSGYFIG